MTVSKATAHLASVGYINIKQGSGGKVNSQKTGTKKKSISLLVNKEEKNLDLPINYFYKDIYLAYLLFLNNKNYEAKIISYKKGEKNIPVEFYDEIKNSDGVITLGELPECYFKFFDSKDIPIVLIERKIPIYYKSRIGSIFMDTSKLEEAVNYMISLGHENILYAIDDEINDPNLVNLREDVVKKALDNWPQKLPLKIEVFRFTPNDNESAEKLKNFMTKGFKAAICYNDISALNLYTLLNILKKNIPMDFSIIGIDDILPSKIAVPPLTTIRVNIEELTLKAINMVEKFLTGEFQGKIIENIDTELVIRKSVYRNIAGKN